jgi:hypothetical protein
VPAKNIAATQAGTGVICGTWRLQAAVVPAKAGIYSANLRKCTGGLDSRLRGNDRRTERDPTTNDTTTLRRGGRGSKPPAWLCPVAYSVGSVMCAECRHSLGPSGKKWRSDRDVSNH